MLHSVKRAVPVGEGRAHGSRQACIRDMNFALDYARENRRRIMEAFKREVSMVFKAAKGKFKRSAPKGAVNDLDLRSSRAKRVANGTPALCAWERGRPARLLLFLSSEIAGVPLATSAEL